ncbi:outer membrane protein assembly factor BamE domain-containing protein [Brevifollis gellanilyticus]|uniref:Outer membrane protein assembly factor BamE domain-containing protein n=1 Tax=Brevifollis gellanilyticus TaxID=748831 RepID=A0A512MAY1_9BACT|nr:outer membrane protein assembly factor BamE [Brevifollis gellanilyticus]GEP43899.1 hypothetical protein BGE01nite_31900 [Brevifollis gellanilyticus]
MSKTRPFIIAAVSASLALGAFLAVRAFQPPFPLAKLEAVKPGMSQSQVRELLGEPSDATSKQWTYQRVLAFGYVNVLFDANGLVRHGHYETF